MTSFPLQDTPPSEESIRHALESILALQAVWGVGVEVVHSLWLYFSRKLVSFSSLRCPFRILHTVQSSNFFFRLRRSTFFSKFRIQWLICVLRTPNQAWKSRTFLLSKCRVYLVFRLHPFTLFCDVTMQAFLSNSADVLNMWVDEFFCKQKIVIILC